MKAKFDVYQTITDKFITALESGVKPWVQPWDNLDTGSAFPANFHTKNTYNGINILLLWMSRQEHNYQSNYWLTYKQANELGGQVRKGEKSTMITFYKKIEVKNDAGDSEEIPVIRAYNVFNLDQIDGLEVPETITNERDEFTPIERAESLIAATQANIIHFGDKAFYSPSKDIINMPERQLFAVEEDYYATCLHEILHWTAHKSRLDRNLRSQFGDKDYAFEELIAEIGSAFLMNDLGIDGDVQHESYVASWLKKLNNDKNSSLKPPQQRPKLLCSSMSLTNRQPKKQHKRVGAKAPIYRGSKKWTSFV